jgi:hypothetical protein
MKVGLAGRDASKIQTTAMNSSGSDRCPQRTCEAPLHARERARARERERESMRMQTGEARV